MTPHHSRDWIFTIKKTRDLKEITQERTNPRFVSNHASTNISK